MTMTSSFSTYLFKKEGNVWDVAIHVPKAEAEKLTDLIDKRVLCTINNQVTIHAALMPQGNGDFFINTNKEIRNKLRLAVNDKAKVTLAKDDSKYGMPLPEELKTAWELDPEGHQAFHTLTIGKQRSLIHVIGKPKSTEIRIRKALTVLEYLKSVNGKFDFKELNEAFKLSNQK